jgi:hypothetical protein
MYCLDAPCGKRTWIVRNFLLGNIYKAQKSIVVCEIFIFQFYSNTKLTRGDEDVKFDVHNLQLLLIVQYV